jgi:starvation-inducible outer membrane lipoprotein
MLGLIQEAHMRWLAVTLSLVLAACTTTAEPVVTHTSPTKLSSAQIQSVQGEVKRLLKDPYSVRFGDILAIRDNNGAYHICVWHNAKNSFGAYTGMRPWYIIMTNGTFRHRTSIAGDDLETSSTCGRMAQYYSQ